MAARAPCLIKSPCGSILAVFAEAEIKPMPDAPMTDLLINSRRVMSGTVGGSGCCTLGFCLAASHLQYQRVVLKSFFGPPYACQSCKISLLSGYGETGFFRLSGSFRGRRRHCGHRRVKRPRLDRRQSPG